MEIHKITSIYVSNFTGLTIGMLLKLLLLWLLKVLEKEIKEKRLRMIELSQAPGDELDGAKLAEERRIVEER